jgi:hypothetical protein
MTNTDILERAREKFESILHRTDQLQIPVEVVANPLTPEEAIGQPQRRDFPIIEGKERMVEATVKGARGHAFTDMPGNYQGTLKDVLDMPLDNSNRRAIFISTMNAAMRHLHKVEQTVHCKDEDPENCSREIARYLLDEWGRIRIGLIGLNPAIADSLIATYGAANVSISDLNPGSVGAVKQGVRILDGRQDTDTLIENADGIVITGTTLVNRTIDSILEKVEAAGKKYILYGVSCAAVCKVMGLPRICPFGRNE